MSVARFVAQFSIQGDSCHQKYAVDSHNGLTDIQILYKLRTKTIYHLFFDISRDLARTLGLHTGSISSGLYLLGPAVQTTSFCKCDATSKTWRLLIKSMSLESLCFQKYGACKRNIDDGRNTTIYTSASHRYPRRVTSIACCMAMACDVRGSNCSSSATFSDKHGC